jgi:hypothetical protein
MSFQRKRAAAIGTKASYPGFIEPALATAVDSVPSGKRWLHEIKKRPPTKVALLECDADPLRFALDNLACTIRRRSMEFDRPKFLTIP